MRNERRLISFSSTGTLMACLSLVSWGCCPGAHQVAQAPPPPPKPCPAATASAPPPPPPPPKCEALDEQCQSTEETRLAIGDNTAEFQPPVGWLYAKEQQQSVTVSPDGKAWLAFTKTSSEKPKVLLPAIESLAARLKVEDVRTKLLKDRLKKAQHEVDANGISIGLWEVDKKSQFGTEPMLEGSEAGTLLLAVASLAPEDVLVGTAFVTSAMGDKYAQIVMQSVQSLRAIAAPSVAPVSDSPTHQRGALARGQ